MGLSSSVTPLGAPSSCLKLPVESLLPLVKPPAFLGNGTRVLEGAGCSTGVDIVADDASVVPFVELTSSGGESAFAGTSREPRFKVLLRDSVGDVVLTGKRVWLRSRRWVPFRLGPGETARGER
jgi:hypothetical protein